MVTRLSLLDPRIRWEGHAELAREGEWLTPRRLKAGRTNSEVHPELLRMADMAAGVSIHFSTDASEFRIQAETSMPKGLGEAISPFDLMVNGRLAGRQVLQGAGVVDVTGLGHGTKEISVWLPQFGVTRLSTIELSDAAFISASRSPRPHWITYGSSITHCREASGPSDAWPARVSTKFAWRLTALGFAGQCHLDPVVAQHIRDTPADLISMCLGINIWAASSLSGRTLGPMLSGFLDTVREGHPVTPLVITTPISSPERERKLNAVGLTLHDVRTLVHDVTLSRSAQGDSALTLIDGRDLLGEEDSRMLVDGLHPGPEGYRQIADRMGPILQHRLSTREINTDHS